MQERTAWFVSDFLPRPKEGYTGFTAEPALPYLTHAAGTSNSFLGVCTTQNTTFCEEAIPFWLKRYGLEAILTQLGYQGHREVLTSFPWWTSTVSHISWISKEERAVGTDDGTCGHTRAFRSEQKGSVSVKYVFLNSSCLDEQLMNAGQVPFL